MTRILILLAIGAVALSTKLFFFSEEWMPVSIGDKGFLVEIADTPEERRAGLMERKSLDQDKGMLFVYPQEQMLSFWMKNTLIPLDMIFIDAKKQIIHIQKQAQPCRRDPCQNYESPAPAQYVLELNGGQSDLYGIELGDTVEF